MIIEKHKTIFIHIPKNAGTSISTYFGPVKHTKGEQIASKHDTIKEIKSKFPAKYTNYKKFAIIRNPYDRMVSWYFYLNGKAKVRPIDTPPPFQQWIKNPMKFFFDPKRFLDPQHTWIDDTVSIVKYENLNKELNKFFGEKIDLSIVNNSNHEHYLSYYNEESLNIVYNKYKEDFKKYNYKKI